MSITIKVSGSTFKLDTLAKRIKNLEKPTLEATTYLERQTKLRFAKEVDPDNAPWARLKPSTLARKTTNNILIETTTLVNSITSFALGVTGKVFTTIDYGIYHQMGTRWMAARRFLGINDEDTQGVVKIYTRYLGLT